MNPSIPLILSEPIGRLHWAGTETATQHQGFMDGAISAGYRAANEVITNLEQGHVWKRSTRELRTMLRHVMHAVLGYGKHVISVVLWILW